MKIYQLTSSSDGGNYEPWYTNLITEDLAQLKKEVMNIITDDDFIVNPYRDPNYNTAYKITTWENGRTIYGFYILTTNKMETLEWMEKYVE